MINSRIKGKSPLGKPEEKAGEKLITSILYNAFEEGGEEFVEYAADFLLDGAADMVFKGEWQQEWSWEEVIENAKIGAMAGGLFGGYQKLMNKIYTGNPEVDAQLDRAAKAYADYMVDAYRLQSDPELRVIAEQQTADKNGSDYFGSAEDVAVLIDKYKADLDLLKAENGAQNAETNAQDTNSGAQNEKAAEKAAESEEPKVQSYEDFKKNPPAEGDKSPIKVSPYTVIKSPYEGESPSNKADAKSERVEVSAESFAEGKSVYEIRTSGAGQPGIVAKVKKALTNILNSIGGQHSVTANNVEFDGKPYEVAVNMSIAGKLAGDPNASAEKFAALKNIDGIIENAEYVGSSDYIQHGARNKNVTRYDYFETRATIDGKPYIVAFDVEVIPGTNKYRTHKVLNEINLTSVPSVESSPRLDAQGKKSGLQGDVPSPKTNIPQNGSNVKPGSEYSPEYQNGAEHPGTVGGMESDRSNITRAANESGVLPAKKNPFSDFDKYKADENVPSGEKAALARTINDPMLGEITIAQNVTNMAKDGAKFIEQDGKFYAQYEDGTSTRISKSAYNFGKFLNEQGVQYTLNQNAEMPQRMGKKYVSKAVTSFIASRGGTKESSAVQRIGEL